MFMQAIIGRTNDPAGLQERTDHWVRELSPGAPGWLGTTAGVTEDGRFVVTARFESAEAAKANNDRPEQGEWWDATSELVDGEPQFLEGTEIDIGLDGGSDDAGFVQVMKGTCSDPRRLGELEDQVRDALQRQHPALIGTVRLWHGDGGYVEAAYFTDEAGAREGEKAMEHASEFGEQMAEWQQLMGDVEYFDLRSPVLRSP